ncbi:MFS general substrate transporter-53 [Coleophoma cylindrospora]|uniref:MFS general substrate transporter-53 n=1 Tax=Coleophoma cylindrospora TaxID=1849047 RepID=A0A3D8R5H4_9HELO|nr:MFS general substrate transporter-53 [Coleophoma cylindrospora]
MADKMETTSFEHVNTLDTAMTHDERSGEMLFERERDLNLWQAIRTHKRILVHCIAAFGAGMVFGYDTIANGASISMPAFLAYFGAAEPDGTLYLPSTWASLWVAMSSAMQVIGGFLVPFASDRYGRKWPCVAACLISVAGVGMQYAATTRALLLGGKMINGFAIGAILTTATAWSSEISPMRLRGPVQSAIVLFTFFMQAVGLICIRMFVPNINPSAFRYVFAIQWTWPIFTGILFVFVPESPTYLIMKGRTGAATKSLERLYGPQNSIPARLAHLSMVIRLESESVKQHGTGTYMDLFRGTNLKRTLTVMWMFIGFGMAGACLLAQAIYFLIIAGLPAIHAYDIAIGGFGLAIFAIVGSWFYMEKMGRRSLFLTGAVVNCVVMFVIGGLYYSNAKGALWAVAIIMNLLISWQAVTLVSTSWAITGEISSYRLRGKTQAIAVMSNAFSTWLFAFTVAYIYNVDAGNLGIRAGFVYGGGSLLFVLGSFFLVPDLRGFAVEEVDWLYENKISVLKFRDYADGKAKEAVVAKEKGVKEGFQLEDV